MTSKPLTSKAMASIPMTSKVDALMKLPPFGLEPKEKADALLPAVQEELAHHYEHCRPFGRWCDRRGFDPHRPIDDLADVPFLPVSIFKRLSLRSVPEDQVVRVLSSSATSSQIPSTVFLDTITRNRQIRSLGKILTHLIGGKRRPFVVLDAAGGEADGSSRQLTGRAAGMRGYLMASTSQQYVLDHEDGVSKLNVDRLLETVARLKKDEQPFCFLGYTYMLYQYVVRPLREQGISLDLPAGVRVIHFGGWKKLQDRAVDRATLNAHTAEALGVDESCISDVYGFTEQLGLIYPDGADGVKRTPTYSEVFVRDPRTLELVPDGEVGLLEFVCPLPHGYPGVAILLDDMGRVVTREPDLNGMTGTGFEVVGRASGAEARGCGDTLPNRVYQVATEK